MAVSQYLVRILNGFSQWRQALGPDLKKGNKHQPLRKLNKEQTRNHIETNKLADVREDASDKVGINVSSTSFLYEKAPQVSWLKTEESVSKPLITCQHLSQVRKEFTSSRNVDLLKVFG